MQLASLRFLFPSSLGSKVLKQSQNILGNSSANENSPAKVLSLQLTHSQNNHWACLIYIFVAFL